MSMGCLLGISGRYRKRNIAIDSKSSNFVISSWLPVTTIYPYNRKNYPFGNNPNMPTVKTPSASATKSKSPSMRASLAAKGFISDFKDVGAAPIVRTPSKRTLAKAMPSYVRDSRNQEANKTKGSVAGTDIGARTKTSKYSNSAICDLAAFAEKIHKDPVLARIDLIRQGVPSALLATLAERMEISNSALFELIRLPQSTASRLTASGLPIPQVSSEIAVWVMTLVNTVKNLVLNELGNPLAVSSFNHYRWVYVFLTSSSPALGGATPAEFMDTSEGRDIVAKIPEQMAFGVYG
jgi:hypothetical protein